MTDVKIKCDSCKFVDGCVDYGWSECKKFTQKPSEPMTNEEYLKSCTTEQLAEWMALRLNPGILLALRMKCHCTNINAVREWLKQPHDNILKP